MNTKIPRAGAVQAIRLAFLPLACAVEFYDHDKRIRFRVLDHNDSAVVDVTNVLARRVQDPRQLNLILSKARAASERKGFQLHAWSMPN